MTVNIRDFMTDMETPPLEALEDRLFRALWKQSSLITRDDQHREAAAICARYLLRWDEETAEEHKARVLPLLEIGG